MNSSTKLVVLQVFCFLVIVCLQAASALPPQLRVDEITTPIPFICPGNGNYPVPGQECTGTYYACASGKPVLSYCAGASIFDPLTSVCTNFAISSCAKTTPSRATDSTTETSTKTASSTSSIKSTTESTPHNETTTDAIITQSTTVTTPSTSKTQSTTTVTSRSTTASSFVCPSTNGIFPNPRDCYTFYICSNQAPYLYECPSETVFNPVAGYCDYAQNVPSCK